MIDILSFGGGVGSWGYAAAVVLGHISVPWLAVTVDTRRECPSTWEYIERHRAQLPFPLHIARHKRLPPLTSGNGETFLPGGYTADGGWARGFCTSYWKRDYFRRWMVKRERITIYRLAFGIHADEWDRARSNRLVSVKNIYPLVSLGITRAQCAEMALEVFGELPPRSRCWMCAGQAAAEWDEVREKWPDLYADAKRIDAYGRAEYGFSLFGEGGVPACGGECGF